MCFSRRGTGNREQGTRKESPEHRSGDSFMLRRNVLAVLAATRCEADGEQAAGEERQRRRLWSGDVVVDEVVVLTVRDGDMTVVAVEITAVARIGCWAHTIYRGGSGAVAQSVAAGAAP